MKYNVIWSDGSAAASRGGTCDEQINTTVECDPKDIWSVLYLMKYVGWLDDVNGGLEDPEFKAEIFDYFGVDAYDEDEGLARMLTYTEEDFEDGNLDDIDGGASWVLCIKDETGNVIYECDDFADETDYDEMDYDEAYDYLTADNDIDPDTAEEILDNLEEYTREALDDAISELTESLHAHTRIKESMSTGEEDELTAEEMKKYLRDRGFSETFIQQAISDELQWNRKMLKNLERYVHPGDGDRKNLLRFQLAYPFYDPR